MDNIDRILNAIKTMFVDIGLEKAEVTNPRTGDVEINYVKGDLYCIPLYLKSLGFLIEYADSLEDAQRLLYEDGDSFPLSLGEAAIIEALKREVMIEIET